MTRPRTSSPLRLFVILVLAGLSACEEPYSSEPMIDESGQEY